MPKTYEKKILKQSLKKAIKASHPDSRKLKKLLVVNEGRGAKKGTCPIPPEKRFQKGVSGNPGGRPKGVVSISSLLVRLQKQVVPAEAILGLREVFPDFEIVEGMSVQEAIMSRVCLEAIRGDANAREFIAERTEGRVPATFHMGGLIKPKTPLTDGMRAEMAEKLGIQIVPPTQEPEECK